MTGEEDKDLTIGITDDSEEKKCAECGNTFYRNGKHARNWNKQVCCSAKCATKFRVKTYSGLQSGIMVHRLVLHIERVTFLDCMKSLYFKDIELEEWILNKMAIEALEYRTRRAHDGIQSVQPA